ncbi:hypothetical protein FMN50_10130 [Rhodobacterales bacterium]|nr:hypothetical protein FMN50_10130 [Rhodobacterales bacterium]
MTLSAHKHDRKTIIQLATRGLAAVSAVALLLSFAVSRPEASQPVIDTGACQAGGCPEPSDGPHTRVGKSDRLVVGANKGPRSLNSGPSLPFSVSVDGRVVDASTQAMPPLLGDQSVEPQTEHQRKAGTSPSSVDIRVKFDGFDVGTALNVSTRALKRAYRSGETVTFRASSNYPAFITKAEVRIGDAYRGSVMTPLYTVPIDPNGTATWVMPDGDVSEFDYALRVYDAEGHFDETGLLMLSRSTGELERDATEPPIAPREVKDRTLIRNIPVNGGAVSVSGRNVPQAYSVTTLGSDVPINQQGRFAIQRILPPGDQEIGVTLSGVSRTGGLNFTRQLTIPQYERFYVALAAKTAGYRNIERHLEPAHKFNYNHVYSKGRVTFYLKGRVQGKYLLAAQAATGEDGSEGQLGDISSQFSQEFARHIEPDRYYPVYGEGPSFHKDAPTSGKFHVRLDRGNSPLTWGRHTTRIAGSGFMHSERSLYAATAEARPSPATRPRSDLNAAIPHIARPETVRERDEFSLTGGSTFFLTKQNVLTGSETVTLEYRNTLTGAVADKEILVANEGYRLDHFQGIVTLRSPPRRSDSLRDTQAYLIADYEHTPSAEDTGSDAARSTGVASSGFAPAIGGVDLPQGQIVNIGTKDDDAWKLRGAMIWKKLGPGG